MLMKVFGKSLFVGLLILGIAGCALAADPIKIGYLATLTGEGATWGQHEREAALMAVKEVNAQGGFWDAPWS